MDGKEVTARYPFDYDAMKKGDRIEPDEIEGIVGAKRKTYDYPLKVASLAKRIEGELWSRGKCYTVCIRDHGISILTDAEASLYNSDRFTSHMAGLARANVKMASVDASEFTEDMRKRHDKGIRDQGAILAATMAARRRNRSLEPDKQAKALPGAE